MSYICKAKAVLMLVNIIVTCKNPQVLGPFLMNIPQTVRSTIFLNGYVEISMAYSKFYTFIEWWLKLLFLGELPDQSTSP